MGIVLGIDLGTGTIRVVAYDPSIGRTLATATRPTPVLHPRPDWSEYAPEDLWQQVAACLNEVSSALHPARPCALAISSFGEPAVPLDHNLRPLAPLQAWYDRRCARQLAELEALIDPALFYSITGQRLSLALGLTKWRWLLASAPDVKERTRVLLPASSYILWRLTGQYCVDHTIAVRTGLFDLHALQWSSRLLELAGLTKEQLPESVVPGTQAGSVTKEAASFTGLPAHMPCYTGAHDHLCATLAVGALDQGSVVDSVGTAEAVLLLTHQFQSSPTLMTSGYTCSPGFGSEDFFVRGNLPASGGAITWLAQQYAPPGASPEMLPYATLEAEAAATIGKTVGPLWLPHLLGSGTPLNDRESMAALVGLRAEHSRGDLFRGLLEALACWLKYNLETLTQITGRNTERVFLLGGLTRLDTLNRLKATLLEMPVLVPQVSEPSALGAALLAGIGAGIFANGREAQETLRSACIEVQPFSDHLRWYRRWYHEVFLTLYETLKPVQSRLAQFREADALSGDV